ncbi:MAG: putative toxin-antitoxin system toxin component, PIN family [bacterium]|nr:putative toxin-antitoxin system toxin component, PIN family [bacterium]
MRVVIDTNILIGGADDESSHAFKIIKEVIDGRIEAFANHQTMSENRQMLRKLVKDREYRELLEEFFRKLNIVKTYKAVNVVSDPEDNKLIESAVSAGAEYLITNDKEVLDIDEYHGTKIITPEEFWSKYQNEKGDDSAWSDWGKMIMGE